MCTRMVLPAVWMARVPAGGALRGPITTALRTVWTMMAASVAITVCIGIPAGFSPYVGSDDYACYIHPSGDNYNNYKVYWNNSCGMCFTTRKNPPFALRSIIVTTVCTSLSRMVTSMATATM